MRKIRFASWVALLVCSLSIANAASASQKDPGYTTIPIDVAETLRAQGLLGWSTPDRPNMPPSLVLRPPRPNPFSSYVTVRYETPLAAHTTVRIYDVAGRLVRTLAQGRQPAGRHQAVWNGRNDGGQVVASGVYFCRVESGAGAVVRRLVLVR